MTDLMTPDEVRQSWACTCEQCWMCLLCRDYISLWNRNKELEALIPKRLIQRVGGTETS